MERSRAWVRSYVGALGDDACMTTALLVLLALAVGLGGRCAAGRRQSRRALTRASWPACTRSSPSSRVAGCQGRGRRCRGGSPSATRRWRVPEEIEAGRQAMVEQFRLLSHEVAEQQRRSVDTSATAAAAGHRAAARAGGREPQGVPGPADRGREGAGRRSPTEMRAQVRTVRDTGEAMRREAATLVTALRKPQVRGLVGRDHAQERRPAVRHGRALRLRPAGHQPDRRGTAAPRHAGQPRRRQARLRRLQGPAQRVPRRRRDRGRAAAGRPPRDVRPARAHPRRPALEQAVLEGRRVARVRRAVPARARSSSPRRSTRCPTSTSTPSSRTSSSPPRRP